MKTSNNRKGSLTIQLTLLFLLLFLLASANLALGSVAIPFHDLMGLFTGSFSNKSYEVILLQYRLPQVFTAIATGMGLSVAGLLLQTVFRNPLAGPSVLGISAGASLGVALLTLSGSALGMDMLHQSFFLSDISLVVGAFAGALFVLALIMYVSSKIGNMITVLIIGIMVSYLVSAVVGVLQFFSGSEELQSFVVWGLGSFAKNTPQRSLGLLLSVSFLVSAAMFLATPLNALLLGESYAQSSGFNVRRYNTAILLLAGLLIALGTAFTGPIAFLGLAVPHLARSWFSTARHQILIPATILTGANLALLCNVLATLPGMDTSLPINAVTSAIGAPIVIWIIVQRSKIKVN